MSYVLRSVGVLAALALVGCTQMLDGKKLEETISAKLKGDKYPVSSVSCPADQPVKKDATFTCKVKFEGDLTVDVNIKQAGEGNVEWEAKGILLVSDFAKSVDKTVKGGSPTAEVTCPTDKPVIVVKKDATLKCSVKIDGVAADYLVTFKDDKGEWSGKAAGGDAPAAAPEKPAAAPTAAASAEPAAEHE